MVTDIWYTEADKDWGEMKHWTGEETVQFFDTRFLKIVQVINNIY